MKEEIWKDVVGYEGRYKVSNMGRIMSNYKGNQYKHEYVEKGIIRKSHLHPAGYVIIRLCKNGKSSSLKVHRIVAIAFIPNPDNLEQVNHIDRNRANNNLNNLEWVSRRENNAHGVHKGNRSSSIVGVSYKHDTKLKWRARIQIDKKVIMIGRYATEYEAGEAVRLAMKQYGITNRYFKNEKSPTK